MIAMLFVVLALFEGPTTTLAGTVVDHDGKPIIGAELVLTDPKQGEAPVVARGKSGEGGRFRLERPAGLAARDRYLIPTLWTIAPGHRVAVMRFAGALPGPDESIQISLGPPARTEFLVESPEGAPVAGARLSVQQIMPDWLSVPDPVAELAERATGPDGIAVLEVFGPDQIGWVGVIARDFGIQPRWLDPQAPGRKHVTLKPVTSLAGRLVPENGVEPKLMKGWRIRAWTRGVGPDPREDTSAGYGAATTDDDGKFALPELAPGGLTLTVVPPGESDLLADVGKLAAVQQDRNNVVEIPVRRSATVTGLVRERDTGTPVAGMKVVLFPPGRSGGVNASTDTEGRYSFHSLAGKARVWTSETPPGYALFHYDREVEVPAGPARREVAAIELIPAAPALRGEVRDEAGRPVAGAEITAEWLALVDGKNGGYSTRTVADADGGFAIEGLAPAARVKLTARHRDRATVKPVETDAGSREPLTVVLAPRPVIAVVGRVLGPGGEPMPGAVVTIRGRETTPNGRHFAMPVQLEGNSTIKTGPDGTFRSPRELDRGGHDYQAEVTATGYHKALTPFVTPGTGDNLTLPDVTLRKLMAIRAIAGRVVDRDGRPVPGATVSQAGDGPCLTATTSDPAGQFRLDGFYDGAALIFAGKAGFRFGGAIVGAGVEPVAITLARDGEPPVARLTALPSPMTRGDERALARELLVPLLPQARAGAMGYLGPGVTSALARVDPARVLTMLENRVIANPAPVIAQIALGQYEDDPRAAIATIEYDLDPGSRAQGFLALADAVPARDRGRRGEFLDRAHAEASRVASAELRLGALREIADRWLDLGDINSATPILREGQTVIAATETRYRVFQAEQFGDVLAAIDLPAAQALFEAKGRFGPPDDRQVRQHLGEAAVRIAAFNPAEAERLSKELIQWNIGDREWGRFRIARRMARADLARARKLLLTVALEPDNPTFARPALVPYGLGLMASDLAAADPVVARGLLNEAFAGLTRIARAADNFQNPSVSILMGVLLPTVERLDPDRVAERLWLAASCRQPRPQEPSGHGVFPGDVLALLASRYDRAMATALAAPALDRLPALMDRTDGNTYYDSRGVQVIAAYDPRAITNLISKRPVAATRTERNIDGEVSVAPEAIARLAGGEMLGLPIEARRREAIKQSGAATTELPAE